MIEKIDYLKYLSYDNGKGILLNGNVKFILENYGIDYYNCSCFNDLIFKIREYMDNEVLEDIDDLEDVLCHLSEMHYYYETKK